MNIRALLKRRVPHSYAHPDPEDPRSRRRKANDDLGKRSVNRHPTLDFEDFLRYAEHLCRDYVPHRAFERFASIVAASGLRRSFDPTARIVGGAATAVYANDGSRCDLDNVTPRRTTAFRGSILCVS